MKKVLAIILVMLVAIAVFYLPALLLLKLNWVWLLLLAVSTFFLCGLMSKHIKPVWTLCASLVAIVGFSIPRWIQHVNNYDISFNELVSNLFKGTPLFYSILGIILGFIIFKIINKRQLNSKI